jgi:hypothetical protein
MKRLILIFAALSIFSCREDDIKAQYDIYSEWRWDATILNPQTTPYKTSQKLDTTYYYNFLKNGTLQIKDVNKVTKSEFKFEIVENELIVTDSLDKQWTSLFLIERNKLKLTNLDGLIAYTQIFKVDR